MIPQYAFQGHTHVPGVFTEKYQFFSPEELNYEYPLGVEKVMINVGSVGQPRDGNPERLLRDHRRRRRYGSAGWRILSRRPSQKIYAVPELDNFLGDRLRDGR